MTPEKCPACGAKLRPDMLACPNCPMSFPEDEATPGSANPLKNSYYYQFLFPVVFLALVGAGIWYMGTGLMRLGLANNQIENGNLFSRSTKTDVPAATSAGSGGSAAAGTASPSETPSDAPSADDGGMMVVVTREDGAPHARTARTKESSPARPAPSPKVLNEWRLRGTVYDLTTLRPVAGCSIVFKDETTNRSIMTQSDSSGSYRALVPALKDGDGYSVAVEKNGYASNYLDPKTEDVRELGAGVRTGMARGLAATLSAAPAIVRTASDKPLVTDFYLAPSL